MWTVKVGVGTKIPVLLKSVETRGFLRLQNVRVTSLPNDCEWRNCNSVTLRVVKKQSNALKTKWRWLEASALEKSRVLVRQRSTRDVRFYCFVKGIAQEKAKAIRAERRAHVCRLWCSASAAMPETKRSACETLTDVACGSVGQTRAGGNITNTYRIYLYKFLSITIW